MMKSQDLTIGVKQVSKPNSYYNSERYPDPTAYAVIKKEEDLEKRVSLLVKAVKTIIAVCGFELIGRIELRDVNSGRLFK